MADFSFLSDTDESAVEEILAEAMDHCVLKQVAAINCSSFSHSDSVLPSHLESRFQRLKTFPSSSKSQPQLAPDSAATESKPSTRSLPNENPKKDFEGNSHRYVLSPSDSTKFSSGHLNSSETMAKSSDRKVKDENLPSGSVSLGSDSSKLSSGHLNSPKNKAKTSGRKVKDENLPSGSVSFGSNSSDSESGHLNSPKNKAKSCGRKVKGENLRSGSVSFGSNSSNSDSGHLNSPKIKAKSSNRKVKDENFRFGSVSFGSTSHDSEPETTKRGCFWCSPKRVTKKKSGNRSGVAELGVDWGKHDDILSDLKSFSSKEQKKNLKAAMKEQEKIKMEAEKIVKWAKQTSARLDFSVADDLDLSDDDRLHGFH